MTANDMAKTMRAVATGLAMLLSAASAQAQPTPAPAEILDIVQKAADWQLDHLDTTHIPAAPDDQMSPRGWVYGTLFVGMTALADISPEHTYADAIIAHGVRENWQLEVRPFHADDYLIGQSWIWAYERNRDPAAIAAVRQRFDAIIDAAPNNSLEYGTNPPPYMESACQKRWCWADSLFMGPQVFTRLSRATHDPKYLAYADKEFRAAAAFLFDKSENLFARDSRFFAWRGEHGEKIFWSRGNGWVYAGIVRMLQIMPPDHPSRSFYEDLYRKMSARLTDLQKPDGYWPPSLLAPRENTPPETSGTAFYTYGLAYGVRTGLLTEPRYRTAAMRGWAALTRAVDADGKLGWVQGIGVGPDRVTREDTGLFGVGAFLLAGSEMYKLALQDALPGTLQRGAAAPGYAGNTINAVSMARDALITADGWQFAAFYGPVENGRAPVTIARRKIGDATWLVAQTGFAIADAFSNTGVRDDHNIIAIGIDRHGRLHLAYGMHNAPLAYAISATSVTGQTFAPGGALRFVHAMMIGTQEKAVTYPEFFHAPDGSLMFAYRDGGKGGGSGNGNEYINRFDEGKTRWRRIANPMVDGISTSMNAYLNAFVFDASGTLHASWTIRETPHWQSNHDVYLVSSPDGGKSWIGADGTALGATVTRQKADAHAKILSLPQGSSLINQTDMAMDAAGKPMIATWWAPRAASGDHTRQYMLIWNDGTAWRTSQISQRAAGETIDETSARVRELARPLVMVDGKGRTLVIARSADGKNRPTVYWSVDRIAWNQMILDDGDLGNWEPVYDRRLWHDRKTLSLLLQATGEGRGATPVMVLDWDESALFDRR